MSDVTFRAGIRSAIRPIMEADLQLLLKWYNDPDITDFLLRCDPIYEQEEREWIASRAKDKLNFVFTILALPERRPIGNIGLHRINWPNRTATTGTTIGEKEFWGRGYGTDAKMLLLDYAFNVLDLYAIESRVIAFNERSLAYGKKCGYHEVGRIPQWNRRASTGERFDEVILLVTQDEWRPLWKEYVRERSEASSVSATAVGHTHSTLERGHT